MTPDSPPPLPPPLEPLGLGPGDWFSVDHGRGVFYRGDALRLAERVVHPGSVDLVFTDPPFGIDGARVGSVYNRDAGLVVGGYVDVPAAEYAAFTGAWARAAWRLLRPGGAVFASSGWTHAHVVKQALLDAGFRVVNEPVWRYDFGVWTTRKFITSHYPLVYAAKPPDRKRTFNAACRFPLNVRDATGNPNYRDREDVWVIPRERRPGLERTANMLPTALVEKVLAYTTNPGDLVADFFGGSFQIGTVALATGRRTVGFELGEQPFQFGRRHVLGEPMPRKRPARRAAKAGAPTPQNAAPAASAGGDPGG